MSSKTGAIRAGRAFVELFAEDTALRKGLAKASARLRSWGASVAKIGAMVGAAGTAITAPILGALNVFSDAGSSLNDMSQRTGIAVDALSELKWAAELSGTSLETLEGGVKGMQKMLSDAGKGGQTAVDTLAELGLTVEQLQGLSPDAQLSLMASSIASISDPAQKAAAAMKSFGGSGQQLVPLLSAGAEGIEAMRAEARALGITMSGEDARAAGEFANALNRLKAQFRQIALEVGSSVAPMLTEFLDKMKLAGRAAIDWMRDNKPIVKLAFGIGTALMAAGAALVGVGLSLSLVGGAFTGLVAIVSGLTAAVGAAVAAFKFLLTPIGAAVLGFTTVISAVTGCTAATLKWASALDRIKSTWPAIAEAIRDGDLETAYQIAFQGLKVAWMELVKGLRDTWSELSQDVMEIASAAKGILTLDMSGAGAVAIGEAYRKQRQERARELAREQTRLEELMKPKHPADLPGKEPLFRTVPLGLVEFAPIEINIQDLKESLRTIERPIEGTYSSLSARMFAGRDSSKADKSLESIDQGILQLTKLVGKLGNKTLVFGP